VHNKQQQCKAPIAIIYPASTAAANCRLGQPTSTTKLTIKKVVLFNSGRPHYGGSSLALGALMSPIERLLQPGSTDTPECRCRSSMTLRNVEQEKSVRDSAIKVFLCEACGHEMRLTVWAENI
jgi:hypothetical protein